MHGMDCFDLSIAVALNLFIFHMIVVVIQNGSCFCVMLATKGSLAVWEDLMQLTMLWTSL